MTKDQFADFERFLQKAVSFIEGFLSESTHSIEIRRCLFKVFAATLERTSTRGNQIFYGRDFAPVYNTLGRNLKFDRQNRTIEVLNFIRSYTYRSFDCRSVRPKDRV